MRRVVCVAIPHSSEPNLFLHGLRVDNQKYSLPGGHASPGETDREAAYRELEEETGITGMKLDKVHEMDNGDLHVSLFMGRPFDHDLSPKSDPDKEFVTFKYLDPKEHPNMHVPGKRNILSSWLSNDVKKIEGLSKVRGKITVEPFLADKERFDPRKHDFIVRVSKAGKQVGFLAVAHRNGGLMPFNMEVAEDYRRKGFGTALANHAQKISGKKILTSPDMTESASCFMQSFSGAPMKKTEIMHNEDSSSLMNRVETKHFMPKSSVDRLLNGIKFELPDGDPDTSVRFNVNKTIYLDNRDLDALRDNMEGSKPRFKVRIRQYSPNGEHWEDVAYLELKMKTTDGETKKIRVRIPASLIDHVSSGGTVQIDESLEKLNLDIPKDVLWKRVVTINTIIEKYGFRKQITVTYQRRAFSSEKIRVTIDDSVRYSDAQVTDPESVDMIKDSSYWKAFKKRHLKVRGDDYVIVEVKEEAGIPKWLRRILEECGAEEVRFSKYCAAMVSFIKSGEDQEGPITRDRKIDANSVLSAVDGYEVFNKSQVTAPPAPLESPDLVLSLPVTVVGKSKLSGGSPIRITVKNFGKIADPSQIKAMIDGFKPGPVHEKKLLLTPHKIKGLDGRERHVLSVSGLPQWVDHVRASSESVGYPAPNPHLMIDESDWVGLNKIGRAVSSKEARLQIHPPELKLGDTVLKTY